MPASEERRVIQALAFILSYYYCIIFPTSLNCVRVLIKRYTKEKLLPRFHTTVWKKTVRVGRWEVKLSAYSNHTMKFWTDLKHSCFLLFCLDVFIFQEHALVITTTFVPLPHLFYIIWKFAWLCHSMWQGWFGWNSNECEFI